MIKRLKQIVFAAALMTVMISTTVHAEMITDIVMTYQDKVFTKQMYDIEIEQIKAGGDTDGLRDIEGLLENLTFQTNGEVSVNKSAVVKAIKEQINAGYAYIKIDLTEYTGSSDAGKDEGSHADESEDTDDSLGSLGIDCKLSEASTRFRANEDRAQNIRNAASKINGRVIMPGQTFSCTMAFGARTVANGYGYGNIISGDKYVKGLGGGICQVSSTLNLAMLRAGVAPLERHNHSHRSSYIASGLDATISGKTLDYKFTNPYEYPLYISAVTSGGVITISVYSNHEATGGVVYEPVVVGGKMSNTTHIVGKLNGEKVSDRIVYSSRYSK